MHNSYFGSSEREKMEESEEDIDPRIRSFMTIVSKEISDKSVHKKAQLRETQRRQEVQSELSRIRDLEERIEKQNDLAKESIEQMEELGPYSTIHRVPTDKNRTQTVFSETTFEREPKEEKKLDQSDVDTLITRVHQYYERIQKDDQDVFFDSNNYINAEKYDSVGRDFSIVHRKISHPPKVTVQRRIKPNDPRPMNLETRFASKKFSPGKYRCLSCEKLKKLTLGDSIPKLRPFADNPTVLKDASKSVKKSILETQFLMSKGRLKRAKEVIEDVLHEGYENSDAYFLSGEIDRQIGIIAQAEQKLLKALTFQVFTPKVYFSLGLLYNYKKEFDKAVRCFKKFLFNVETPEAHFELGFALMELNSPSEACIHFSRAIILDPEEPDYYLKRAKCYETQGLEELAQEDYDIVLKIDPTYHLEHVSVLHNSEMNMDLNTSLKERELLNKILP
ncbi:unnamed protein product [Moneuplotes crassus]|uniref:Tetratricopeptide repeat protein n=1 Tax=Euplotes crassus TaxID=5936 RepID=A0AAD1UPK9_EUPCR|nr:unnamed protein product [Moneuplotes crassus]